MAHSQDLAIHVKQRNDEAEAEGHPVVKTAHYPQEPNSSTSSNRFSAAWLGESYTIAITIPLKRKRTRSTAITLNETNTLRHTLREQGTRFGDKSGSKVNFTRVIIAKIPFIVGERASSALAVSVVLFCLHFYSEIVELHILRDVTMACLLLLSFAGYLSPNFDERTVLGV